MHGREKGGTAHGEYGPDNGVSAETGFYSSGMSELSDASSRSGEVCVSLGDTGEQAGDSDTTEDLTSEQLRPGGISERLGSMSVKASSAEKGETSRSELHMTIHPNMEIQIGSNTKKRLQLRQPPEGECDYPLRQLRLLATLTRAEQPLTMSDLWGYTFGREYDERSVKDNELCRIFLREFVPQFNDSAPGKRRVVTHARQEKRPPRYTAEHFVAAMDINKEFGFRLPDTDKTFYRRVALAARMLWDTESEEYIVSDQLRYLLFTSRDTHTNVKLSEILRTLKRDLPEYGYQLGKTPESQSGNTRIIQGARRMSYRIGLAGENEW